MKCPKSYSFVSCFALVFGLAALSACALPSQDAAARKGKIDRPSTARDQVPKERNWQAEGQAWIAKKAKNKPANVSSRAKNIILFIGDGMGISTITAARIRKGQLAGLQGEEAELSFEHFDYTGLVKTYNTDAQVPDSAGTMTAMVTGEKTRKGLISVGAAVPRQDCAAARRNELLTIADLVKAEKGRVGIVTTTSLTHATPAAVYAHAPERSWEDDSKLSVRAKKEGCADIAVQLKEAFADEAIDLAFGGGERHFRPKSQGGRRIDQRDLLGELGGGSTLQTVFDRDALLKLNKLPAIGVFANSHLPYSAQASQVEDNRAPSLAEMSAKAVALLSTTKNETGFFLMIEAGRIDHAHHAGNAFHALEDTLALDRAVSAVLELVDHEETLVIVTADHSHVFTMAGYPPRGNPILGVAGKDFEGNPYTTLGYANGRGHAVLPDAKSPDERYNHEVTPGRKNISSEQTEEPHYHQEVLVGLASETHGGEDVGIWAIGPSSYLLTGTMEQHMVFFAMRKALGASKD